MAYKPLIIEICPHEPRASVLKSPHLGHVLDCAGPGDAEPACDYLRVCIGVDIRIVARQPDGTYKNRKATAAEMAETCRAIYFDSEADFDNEDTARTYLIWEAANGVANEGED